MGVCVFEGQVWHTKAQDAQIHCCIVARQLDYIVLRITQYLWDPSPQAAW